MDASACASPTSASLAEPSRVSRMLLLYVKPNKVISLRCKDVEVWNADQTRGTEGFMDKGGNLLDQLHVEHASATAGL